MNKLYKIKVFGKEGCAKCKTLNQRGQYAIETADEGSKARCLITA